MKGDPLPDRCCEPYTIGRTSTRLFGQSAELLHRVCKGKSNRPASRYQTGGPVIVGSACAEPSYSEFPFNEILTVSMVHIVSCTGHRSATRKTAFSRPFTSPLGR